MFGGGFGVSSGDGVSSSGVGLLVMRSNFVFASERRALGICNMREGWTSCFKSAKLLAGRVAVIVGDLGSLEPSR
ncbi:hypothetical protein E6O75_ATG10182 [Venturia nashicola]|uniref:Uncharacterized protein n=1 Tax=Venturia nashicola TaxID=86259 RepID=A0A4Z1NXM0_9PEZI|nr:hypothetical protein E6O75_ATG10182 [Venturia nashicola]